MNSVDWITNNYGADVSGFTGMLHLAPSKDSEQETYQKMLSVDELMDVCLDKPNMFLTLNTFKSAYRRVRNIKQLRAFYIDIDPYHIDKDKDEVLTSLSKKAFGREIPYPSEVVNSGGGFYLIWFINPVGASQLKRWRGIQAELHNILEEYGSDSATLDAARVLRVPGSINLKRDKPATVSVSDLGSKITYSIDEIEDWIKPTDNRPMGYIEKSKRADKSNARKKAKKERRAKRFEKTYVDGSRHIINQQIAVSKAHDIKVVLLYKGKGVVGIREKGLFLFRHYLTQSGTSPDSALAATLELNSQLAVPLSTKEVIAATKSPEGAWYNIGVQRLIEELKIPEELEPELLILISINEKRKRRRRKYGRTISRREETTAKQETIKVLRGQGKKVTEICFIMGISKTTYYNLQKNKRKHSTETKRTIIMSTAKNNRRKALRLEKMEAENQYNADIDKMYDNFMSEVGEDPRLTPETSRFPFAVRKDEIYDDDGII